MIKDFENFDINAASVAIWVFKKRVISAEPVFNGYWVTVSDELGNEVKSFIKSVIDTYTEIIDYELLAQNNEVSLLQIDTGETSAPSIIKCSANETENKKVTSIKKLANSEFYSIKLVFNENVLHCIKRTDASWKTKKTKGLTSIVFKNSKLELDNSPKFNISKDFDFFIFNGKILIKNKKQFESILSYKAAYLENFEELLIDTDFSNLFVDSALLTKYVGNNAMQLRRASAIKQKQYYKKPEFMKSLSDNVDKFKFNINFDENGKIVVTTECCPDIFQALLDHRLQSHYVEHIYDVPNAQRI